MSGDRKERITLETPTVEETREVYLKDGRTLSVADDLVEIRGASGTVEVRIRLTDQGPVLQMESVRLQLKATEAVEIESRRVDIKATEGASLDAGAGELQVRGEADIKVDAKGEVRINGKMIWLN